MLLSELLAVCRPKEFEVLPPPPEGQNTQLAHTGIAAQGRDAYQVYRRAALRLSQAGGQGAEVGACPFRSHRVLS